MRNIRNSAKALIVQGRKLLCTKNEDQFGVFYLLPGGGQESGENIHEALRRECLEEISAEISIGDIKFIREYIGKNHEFFEWDSEIHQIEYMFQCSIDPKCILDNGSVPDSMQIGVEWLDLEKISEYRIYPSVLKNLIKSDGSLEDRVYLGDVN